MIDMKKTVFFLRSEATSNLLIFMFSQQSAPNLWETVTNNYGTSPFYGWESSLFRLGHFKLQTLRVTTRLGSLPSSSQYSPLSMATVIHRLKKKNEITIYPLVIMAVEDTLFIHDVPIETTHF